MKKLFVHHKDPLVLEALLPQLMHANFSYAYGRYLGDYESYHLILIDDECYQELTYEVKRCSKLIAKHGREAFDSEYFDLEDTLIDYSASGAAMSVLGQWQMKPLRLDFEQFAYRQRLLRGGRQKESVARAVLSGISDGDLIFDATAGLGRESMILAHAGARVMSFERQIPIWLILHDALERARSSRFFPFTLPHLCPVGTIANYQQALDDNSPSRAWSYLLGKLQGARPEVIYYDPMFPEREKSAQVKKDMFLFQQVIGADLDTQEFLACACQLALQRVVVKRPSNAEVVGVPGIERSYFVDGGQCRFDCYQCS